METKNLTPPPVPSANSKSDNTNATTPVAAKSQTDGKKGGSVGSHIGVAAAAAAVGGLGGAAAHNLFNDAETPQIETLEQEQPDTPVQEQQQPTSATPVSEQPISTTQPAEPIVEPIVDPVVDIVDPEPYTDIIEPDPIDIDDTVTTENTTILDPVNPDEIAEAVISGDEIDPNDIEAEDIVAFDEIREVYTVDGESYTAAIFHTPDGEELAMVDIDGDDIFDIITTSDIENDLYSGNAAYAGDLALSVSDAEIMINDDNSYLAHTEQDDVELPDGENFMNDILTT